MHVLRPHRCTWSLSGLACNAHHHHHHHHHLNCSQGLAHNLQALQHPWLVKAEGREDLEECSLDWGLDGNEYAVSIRAGMSWSCHVGLLLASTAKVAVIRDHL